MTCEYGLKRIKSIDQRFYKQGGDGRIELFVAKVVDDFILAGFPNVVDEFLNALDHKFKLGRINKGANLKFLGCSLQRDDKENLQLSMSDYLNSIEELDIARPRRLTLTDKADGRETHAYRSLAGTLLYLGQAVRPQACFVASKMQQKLGRLLVSDVMEANLMLRELKKLSPSVTFSKPTDVTNIDIYTLSDASHSSESEVYGQTGVVCGLKIETTNRTFYHAILWSSHKQRKIAYSSFGAEILAAADADDRGYYLKSALAYLFPQKLVRHQLLVDSKSLFETITTLHQTGDYRLRKVVARLRDSFEAKELNSVRWIRDSANYADALPKRNLPLSKRLNDMLSS